MSSAGKKPSAAGVSTTALHTAPVAAAAAADPAHTRSSRVCTLGWLLLQVLVVSVTGTPNRPDGVSFTDDFVEAALLAQQAGAVQGLRVEREGCRPKP